MMWLNFLVLLLCAGVMALCLTLIFHMFILGVPYVPTPRKVVEAMVELAALRGEETVYDLGAGDGRLLLRAAADHPDIRAIGVEYVPTVWFWGWLLTRRNAKQVRFRLGDALKQDLRDADVVFLYLMPHLLEKLQAKFRAELRAGTVLVSHRFKLHGLTPQAERAVPQALGKERMVYRYVWA